MPSLRGDHLGAPRARGPVTYPCGRRRPGPGGHLRRRLPHPQRPWQARPASTTPRRTARRTVPDGPDHGPAPRALAHRRHDAPRQGARRDRARGDRQHAPDEIERLGLAPGDVGHRRIPPRPIALLSRGATAPSRPARSSSPSATPRPRQPLTNPALDPFGKIPEFKYCAVRITPGGGPVEPVGYGAGQLEAEVVGD